MRREFKHIYIISSERANRRNDEYRNELRSNREYSVGQAIELDGLTWFVEEVVK